VTGRVLVVGGGIAGMAVAGALSEGGVTTTVVDRLGAPSQSGMGLVLPGNALLALRALGVDDAVVDKGVPIRRREYRNAKGKLLFAVDEAAFWDGLTSSVCLRRADLLAVLLARVAGAAVRWQTGVRAVVEGAGAVEVTFADDRSESAELVIGADGVHSAVRGAVFGGSAPGAALLSSASWRFVSPNPGVDCWSVWSGAQGTFLLVPIDDGHVYGYASATRGGAVATHPAWLDMTFSRFPPPVAQTVATVLAEPACLYHAPIEEVRIPRWSTERVVLIGDAAHAAAPVWAQGAAMAVEDAVVLAELLVTGGDWATVGAEFERRRRPRVGHVQRMTDRLSRAAGLPGWLRDPILPLVGPRSYRETFQPLREPFG
jgi:2-polyprenyl-6-methoxyphenol hydroxylase-like FAD-dependent oxidoreductase